MTYFTYILQCADQTLYIGSTNSLEKRVYAHNYLKKGAHYTKIRRPIELLYSEQFDTLRAAKQREAQLKKLTKQQKLELIRKS